MNPIHHSTPTRLLFTCSLAILTATANAATIDQDGDGHSDIWQLAHGHASSANGDADSDSDGRSDAEEEAAGTDPFAPASSFSAPSSRLIDGATGPAVVLRFPVIAGKVYQAQASPDLQTPSFRPVLEPFLATTTGEAEIEIPRDPDHPYTFYRIGVGDQDIDGDGLTAYEEAVIGTSDLDANSSGHPAGDVGAAGLWLEDHHPGYHPDGGPQANLTEVDLAWVRIRPGAATPTTGDFITVAGTGKYHQLTSWRVAGDAPTPTQLHITPPIEGKHPQIKFLSPGPAGSPAHFVTGHVHWNGTFYLSSRGLTENGTFLYYGSNGWDNNGFDRTGDYDIAYQAHLSEQGVSRYTVVTAILTRAGGIGQTLQVLTWRVEAGTGKIVGVDSAEPRHISNSDGADVRIARVGNGRYQVTLSDQGDTHLRHVEYTVDGSAHIALSEEYTRTTWNTRGSGSLFIPQQQTDVAPLAGGYITAIREPDGHLKMAAWDRQIDPNDNTKRSPFVVAHNEMDLLPFQKGVVLEDPTLTDSFYPYGFEGTNDHLGSAVATGDFDGDGFADVALGAPERNSGGSVYIMHGSASGITGQGYKQIWQRGSDGVPGTPATGDRFGATLTSADFNADGFADIAVGIPGAGNLDSGAVQVLFGSATGLSSIGNQHIDLSDLGVDIGFDDHFGTALATGDFDGDGFDDLAVAAPDKTSGALLHQGTVSVLRGTPTGLDTATAQHLNDSTPGVSLPTLHNGHFGESLAAGDFDNDGNQDLAVGIPHARITGNPSAGAVQLFTGTPKNGLVATASITQNGFSSGGDIAGTPGPDDRFGASLATGDFNGDGHADLAVGTPGEPHQTLTADGAAHWFLGSPTGLTATGNDSVHQADLGFAPDSSGHEFGAAVATGDLNNDGRDDLLVGAPGYTIEDVGANTGGFALLEGTPSGVDKILPRFLSIGTTATEGAATYQVNGKPKADDQFGATITTGDFDADGAVDLVVASPFRKHRKEEEAGTVHFISGSTTYTITLNGNEEWYGRAFEPVRAMVSDLGREQSGGTGAGKLYSHGGENPLCNVASVTKCMTLLLTAEAIEDGFVSLDDVVEDISKLAGKTTGSKLGTFGPDLKEILEDDEEIPLIQTGDNMPLRLLIGGMMNQSCNRSTIAIAQHVSKKILGHYDGFLNMMNDRASQLGMTNSLFGHPAGGWITDTQDMITLLKEASHHPLFIAFGGIEIFGDDQPGEPLCGTDSVGTEKCTGPFPKFISIGDYPGRLAWKGGNGGLWLGSGQMHGVPDRPPLRYATTARVGIVKRLDRTLAVALQQTGDGSNDAENLLDYGFQKIFTPDLCATRKFPQPGGLVGPDGPVRVRNFSADYIHRGWGATAVLDDNQDLRINVWTLDADNGTITPLGFTSRTHSLTDGTPLATPRLVEIVDISDGGTVSEYLTVNQHGEHIDLALWRSGDAP